MTNVLELDIMLEKFDVHESAVKAVSSNVEGYEELQRDQMMSGRNSQGKRIGKYRSNWYAKMKAGMNSMLSSMIPYNVDLKLTGAFQKGITAKVSGDEIDVTSKDSKAADLEGKYGSEIFGLDSKSGDTFADWFAGPSFRKLFTDKTGLTFPAKE